MRRSRTTRCCRAFALSTLLIALLAAALPAQARGAKAGADKPPPPRLPLAQWWTIDLGAPVSAGPVANASRIYVALKTAQLVAYDAADGHEIWRIKKDVSRPMLAAGELLYVAADEAIEAIRGTDHASAWIKPLKPVAPLALHGGLLLVVTQTEVVALRADSGDIAWHVPAGGVKLAPVGDGDRIYVGADDGRLVSLDAKDGALVWDTFFEDGITAVSAYKGRIYVGGGDKILYCLDSAKHARKWPKRLGGYAVGRIAVDEDRVYVASLDNVVWALDRQNGNQRWQAGLHRRATAGTYVSGHIVFVPVTGTDLAMFYDHDGQRSGSLNLPGEVLPGLSPDFQETADGPIVYTVTGSLTNEWGLTKFAPAAETVLLPFAMMTIPGLPYLTDPQLMSIGAVLRTVIVGDPPLQPVWQLGWPIVRTDPPLVPLTILPGVQLRPLSPVLPTRRGGSGPGG